MTMTKENVNKFNKKFIVTALGVAALGFQLMQTNNVKADTTTDSKTGDAASEDTVETKDSSVADGSSIQKDVDSTTETDGTDGTSSDSNNEQQSDGNDTVEEKNNSNTQKVTTNELIENNSDSNKDTPADITDTTSDTQDTDESNSGNNNTNQKIQAESADTTNENNDTANDSQTTASDSTDTDATTDTDSTTSDVDTSDIMIQNPQANQEANNYDDPVKANVSMTATNDKGSVTSESLDEDKNASIVVDSNAQTSMNYTVTNTSNEKQSDYSTIFMLPNYNDKNTSIVVDDSFDPTTMIEGLPEGATVTYLSATGGDYMTYEDQLKNNPNFTPADIMEIQINTNGTSLDPNQEIKITVPLKNTDTSEHQLNTIYPGVYAQSYTYWRIQYFNASYKNMNDSIKSSDMIGQYPAATVNQLGISYTAADQEIQDKMPTYTGGSDIQINNFAPSNKNQLTDADKSDWSYGSHIYVNLVDSGITKIANSDGYSVLLNSDGSQQTQYDYVNSDYSVTVLPNSDNGSTTAASTTKTVSGIYITLRHVINAQDSTTKVGQDWTAADNLTSVQDNDDNVLTGNDAISAVTTTINDQDGVLQDGKVVKAGTFEVTYTYNLKDGTAITKTVTVTADPATNNSGSSSSSSSSSSNTSSNSSSNNSSSTTDPTDPVVSPDSPDNINDQDRLVSTHPADGVVSLYKLDTTKITNRSLNTASDWYSDKDMTFAGETYYRVATNEWVKASNVYVYQNKSQVIQTNNDQQLVDSKGNSVTNRSLLANTAWYTDRIATINGKSYYRVATNEFVPVDAVTVM